MATPFEEWFEKEYSLPSTIESGPFRRELKRCCGMAWDASMEYVLKQIDVIKAKRKEQNESGVN